MLRFDFSETKRQLAFIRSFLLNGGSSDDQKKAVEAADSLLTKLDTRQTVMWIVFAMVSVSATIMILVFIDSFILEQEKYQDVLTSTGRNREVNNSLGMDSQISTTTSQ